jgi:hypothetical protein
MSASTEKRTRDQFTTPIHCPKCGQEGNEIWEENSQAGPHGPESQFVKRSDGFYERLAKKAPYGIEVVCQCCGAVLPA